MSKKDFFFQRFYFHDIVLKGIHSCTKLDNLKMEQIKRHLKSKEKSNEAMWEDKYNYP